MSPLDFCQGPRTAALRKSSPFLKLFSIFLFNMATLTSKYSPVEDVDDAGSEQLFLEHCEACGNPQSDLLSKSKATPHWRLLLIHVGAILFYGILALLATYYLNTKNCHRQSLIYCKIDTRPISFHSSLLIMNKLRQVQSLSTKRRYTIRAFWAIQSILANQAHR